MRVIGRATAVVRTVVGALLVGSLTGGCAVDLLVGGAETSTTGGAESTTTGSADDGTTEVSMPTTETPDESSTGSPGTTSGTTGGEESTTSEGSTTVMETAESSTTEEPFTCEMLGYLDCLEEQDCLWYGDPKKGECALSPCDNPMNDCWEVSFEDCVDLPPCAWVGEPKMGECGPLECVPCEVLTIKECMETPTCVYDEMEMACLPAPE